MSENRLAAETSPYLLQHKDNPVHWRPWGPEALADAARDGKPVLLSVGYAACHWCHVMAHESFENPRTAALMNELFVNIKVDREERPDVDALYQAALAMLGEHGGWPLTMFLKPNGEPFWGGTYFPPEPRFGRPGFRDVLARVAEVYRETPDKVDANAKALRDGLHKLAQNQAAGDIPAGAIAQLAEQLCRAVDPFHGGLGNAPKFPNTPVFELLWRAYLRTGQAPFHQAVITTLDAMALGGIYDHLGGGFARYSTDAHWLAPHFEKMLYDNAQLIDLLTLVWQETGSPLYRARVEETAGWMLREMRAETPDATANGSPEAPRGFASTQDADSEGEEGKFYVWTAGEIDRLLGDDAAAFKAAYDVHPIGNWEGKTILNRRQAPPAANADPALEDTLAACRAKLFAARSERVWPGWDDKVLADWNGLAIAALANAAGVFEEPDWLAAAAAAFAFVCDRMHRDGRLLHCWRAGKLQHPASIDDLANMARAALALHEATGEAGYLDRARDWVATADAHFWDADGGGYFFSADDTEALIARSKTAYDSATPAGNGTMLGVLARLWLLTGEAGYGERARALARAFSGELQRNAMPLATLLNNAALLDRAVQVVLVGPADAPAMADLRRAVHDVAEPDLVLSQVTNGTALPATHPAAGKGTADGPTAYVCRGPVCSLPLTDPEALRAALREGRPKAED